ncbi:MAG: DUF4111 domain-containing protein [Anaerolineales bacterium]|nr:DUF4111 domain-containing protein [Anaerolineales bacterium]
MPQIKTTNTSTPDALQAQLDQITRWLSEIYGAGLLGIYLHGSLAMGCFNTQRSDLDLLAITGSPPSRAQFHATAGALLAISQDPAPVEISLCHYTQLHPWQYPPPFDFHFSEIWRARMEAHVAGATDLFVLEQRDPDLAAHCMVTRRRGLRLAGVAITAAIPEPPWEDYLDAIDDDLRTVQDRPGYDPVDAVLNACRVWAAHAEHQVLSKWEGAEWALRRIPAAHRAIVVAAQACYAGKSTLAALPPEAVQRCLAWIMAQV